MIKLDTTFKSHETKFHRVVWALVGWTLEPHCFLFDWLRTDTACCLNLRDRRNTLFDWLVGIQYLVLAGWLAWMAIVYQLFGILWILLASWLASMAIVYQLFGVL